VLPSMSVNRMVTTPVFFPEVTGNTRISAGTKWGHRPLAHETGQIENGLGRGPAAPSGGCWRGGRFRGEALRPMVAANGHGSGYHPRLKRASQERGASSEVQSPGHEVPKYEALMTCGV